jgi:mono/diheme cytochrome c family protein
MRLVTAATLLLAMGCAKQDQVDLASFDPGPTPAEYQDGERMYVEHCAQCHGVQGKGTQQGPPLVSVIYEPSHHSDMAFVMAVKQGVTAHHWQFGNMPPQPTVGQFQVALITDYVRWLQREAGIQ